MSFCKCCSTDVFSTLFNGSRAEAAKSKKPKRRPPSRFAPMDEADIQRVARSWVSYVHPRAREFFATPETLEAFLMQLASGISAGDDPILGPEDTCVIWHGDVTRQGGEAAIRMVRPDEVSMSITYANRVLAFTFATDE